MKKFYATITACLIMAFLVPMADYMAVGRDTPLYTHYIYMAGHAGWIHYTVNAWSLLILHNLFRWYRVLAAWLWAVAVSFIYLPEKPLIGASVITCFFIGFYLRRLWAKDRLTASMTVGLIALTCILPGFAAFAHVSAMIIGLLFYYAEMGIRRIHNEMKEG